MSSQKSSVGEAVEPKRERGRRRVVAILDAAAAAFAEKGFEATTMTEVASRSGTAIGSLYRFFPTRTALAEALAERYASEAGERLDALAAAAAGRSPEDLAAALVELMLNRRRMGAVIALLEGTADVDRRRSALRARYRDGIEAILRAARPGRSLARAGAAAAAALQMLKGVSRLRDEGGADQPALGELQRALALFLDDVLADGSGDLRVGP